MVNEKSPRGEIKDLVCRARNNDSEAKAKLIEKYMYLVDDKIKKFGFEPTDDVYQIGYLLLSKAVNNYVENDSNLHLSMVTNAYLESCFPKAIERMKESDSLFERTREIHKNPEEANNLREIFDQVGRSDINNAYKKVIYMLAQGYTKSEIAKVFGCSTQLITSAFTKSSIKKTVREICQTEESVSRKK